jgi:predicted membrane chloride channel (bestrophin family)
MRRQIWGGLLNRTRDFVRMGLTWFPDDPALKAQLLRYTVAFAVGTKVHVRGDEDMRTELEKILLRACPTQHNPPDSALAQATGCAYEAD